MGKGWAMTAAVICFAGFASVGSHSAGEISLVTGYSGEVGH